MPSTATIRIVLILLAVLALEMLCRWGVIPATELIPPSRMVVSLWRLFFDEQMREAMGSTLLSVMAASFVAVVGGFLAGSAIHALPRFRQALDPLLASYYAVPTFLFYPVLIVFLGVGHLAIITTAVLTAAGVMVIATIGALDRVPMVLRRTGLVLRMGWAARTWRIVLPAAAPQLFSGVTLAVAYSFIGVIASEFILSGEGMGYAIANAYNEFDNDTMYGLMLLVLVVVGGINGILQHWDEKLRARRRR